MNKKMDLLPNFYKNIVLNWAKCSSEPIDVRNILGQYLWNNKFITIAGRPIFWKEFHRAKSWNQIKREFTLNGKLQFKYMQLVNSIPATWKHKIGEGQPMDLAYHSQGLLLCTRLIPTEKNKL